MINLNLQTEIYLVPNLTSSKVLSRCFCLWILVFEQHSQFVLKVLWAARINEMGHMQPVTTSLLACFIQFGVFRHRSPVVGVFYQL
jgi:hypothetical protein